MYYDTLCLSGGGIKGFAYLGSLKYLNDINFIRLKKIKKFVGTSAGALISYILNLGFDINEIIDIAIKFNFKLFVPEIDIDNIIEFNGIDNGDKFIILLSNLLKYKFNIDNINFYDLHKITKKELHIIGTNYTLSKEEVFNYINTPNMSVITAIRISISVPLIFTPVLYNNYYYIDGGITNNFPINYCNKNKTLGIYISNHFKNEMNNIKSYLHNCFTILFNSSSIKNINNNINIIKINNFDKQFVNFNFNQEYKKNIINIGFISAKNYINNLPTNISNSIINDIINHI